MKPTVLVLGGGPDAERAVSLESSRCVAEALGGGTRYAVRLEVVDRLDGAGLSALGGDVVFPVLHGPFGEGGPLQDLLEADGRPYVGCGPGAARLAMDKMGTKLAASRIGVATKAACVVNMADDRCPLAMPVVLKPVHEGSSVGVHICRTEALWSRGLTAARADAASHAGRVYMVEEAVLGGSELTVGLLDGKALAPIRIVPGVEFYDYEAKYHRNDTAYETDPVLPDGVTARVREWTEKLALAMGVRHLSRVDYLLDAKGDPWLLEVNTMPGFTTHSLLPKAARHAGLEFTALAERLVDLALGR